MPRTLSHVSFLPEREALNQYGMSSDLSMGIKILRNRGKEKELCLDEKEDQISEDLRVLA
jgi:hypothetical protein